MILAIILAKLSWTRSLEQVAVPLRRIISQKKRRIKTEETTPTITNTSATITATTTTTTTTSKPLQVNLVM